MYVRPALLESIFLTVLSMVTKQAVPPTTLLMGSAFYTFVKRPPLSLMYVIDASYLKPLKVSTDNLYLSASRIHVKKVV